MSAMFLTSIPKSGTHLVTTVLECLTGARPTPLRKPRDWSSFDASPYEQLPLLYGHLRMENVQTNAPLRDLIGSRRVFILIRDPRDICVSMLHYLEQSPESGHMKIVSQLPEASFNEKIRAIADGISMEGEAFRVNNIVQHCSGFLELASIFPGACVIKYENFFDDVAAETISDYLNLSPSVVANCIDTALKANTKTKRVGKPYGWKELFEPDLYKFFADNYRGVIERLGYTV